MAVKISLGTVCRNAAGTIRRTLESADSQRGVELEHIVVDGASDDGTVAELQAFRPAHSSFSFVSEPDRGLYDAVNKGLARARVRRVRRLAARGGTCSGRSIPGG